jgi:hypothetical protein
MVGPAASLLCEKLATVLDDLDEKQCNVQAGISILSLVSVALLNRRVNRKSHRKSRLTQGDWGVFRIRVTRRVADRIVDLKEMRSMLLTYTI